MTQYELRYFRENRAFIYERETKKSFCINIKGEVLFELPSGLEAIGGFYRNYALVENIDELRTLINDKGEILYDFKYKDFYSLPDDECDLYTVLDKNNKIGFLDSNFNETTPFIYDGFRSLEPDIALLYKDDKMGAINPKNNKILIPFKYDELYDYKDVIIAKLDNKVGLIDKNNNIIADFKFDEMEEAACDDKCLVAKIGNKWGVIDKQGKTIKEFIYDEACKYRNSNIAALTKYSNDNNCPNCEYGVKNNCCACAKAKRTALYSTKETKFLTDFENYLTEGESEDGKTIIVKANDKYGLIDRTGKIMLPFIYDDIIQDDDNLFFVRVRGLVGVANELGEILIPIKYRYLYYAGEGIYLIESEKGGSGARKGIINKENTIFTFEEPLYFHLTDRYHCGFIIAETKDGDEVYVNKKGKILEIKR